MAKLRLALAAEKDLANIRRYSEREHGAATANKYVRGFNAAFARLREHPLIGSERPSLPPSFRGLTCQRHVIFYAVNAEEILVVRVLHQSQDVPPAETFDLQ